MSQEPKTRVREATSASEDEEVEWKVTWQTNVGSIGELSGIVQKRKEEVQDIVT